MRAGHEPVRGSDAPTPTVSDAPMATYRNGGGVAVGDGVGALVVMNSVGVGVRAGIAVAFAAGALEHAANTSANSTKSLVTSRGYE